MRLPFSADYFSLFISYWRNFFIVFIFALLPLYALEKDSLKQQTSNETSGLNILAEELDEIHFENTDFHFSRCQIENSNLPPSLQNTILQNCQTFLEREVPASVPVSVKEKLVQIKEFINRVYFDQKLPYSHIYRFVGEGATLKLIIHENPIVLIKISGTRKVEEILRLIDIPLQQPYHSDVMADAAQRLFNSDFFQRHFAKVKFVPLVLKENAALLSVQVDEANAAILYGKAQYYDLNAATSLALYDHNLYLSRNELTLQGSALWGDDPISAKGILSVGDFYQEREFNFLRYRFDLALERLWRPHYREEYQGDLWLGANSRRFQNFPLSMALGYGLRYIHDDIGLNNEAGYHTLGIEIRHDNFAHLMFASHRRLLSLKYQYVLPNPERNYAQGEFINFHSGEINPIPNFQRNILEVKAEWLISLFPKVEIPIALDYFYGDTSYYRFLSLRSLLNNHIQSHQQIHFFTALTYTIFNFHAGAFVEFSDYRNFLTQKKTHDFFGGFYLKKRIYSLELQSYFHLLKNAKFLPQWQIEVHGFF